MKLLTGALLFLCITQTNAQLRKVIYATKTVKLVSTGKYLVKGDIFKSDEIIAFGNAKDSLIVLVKDKGIGLMLPPEKAANGNRSELLAYARNTLWFTEKNGHMYGRPGLVNSNEDLGDYLSKISAGRPILIIDSICIGISQNFAMQSAKGFFYIQYENPKGTLINKSLKLTGGTSPQIKIDTALLKLDGKFIGRALAINAKLFYYDAGRDGSVPITSVSIYFTLSNNLKSELCTIGRSTPDWLKDALNYLELKYGMGINDQLTNSIKLIDCN